MKISEVIEELQKVLGAWGDIPIKCAGINDYEVYDIEMVAIGTSKKEKPPNGRMVVIDRVKKE